MKKTHLLIFGLLSLATLMASPMSSGIAKKISFERGKSSAFVKGSLARGDQDIYTVKAKAGQIVAINLSSLEENVKFSLYEAGETQAVNGKQEGDHSTKWTGRLRKDGAFRIVVSSIEGNVDYWFSLAIFSTKTTQSAENHLIGVWEGGDTAAMSIYGTMEISPEKLVWGDLGRKTKPCTAEYMIVKEMPGVKFQDQRSRDYIVSDTSDFSTFLLKLHNNSCDTEISHFRMTMRGDNEVIDLIEYHGLDNPIGWMHFLRK